MDQQIQVNSISNEPKPTFKSMTYEFINDNKFIFALYVASILVLPIKDVLIPHLVGKLYAFVKGQDIASAKRTTVYILITCVIVQLAHVLGEWVDNDMYPSIQSYVREKMMSYQFHTNSVNFRDVDVSYLLGSMTKLPAMFFNEIDVIKTSIIPPTVTLIVIWIYVMYMDVLLGSILGCIILVSFFVLFRGSVNCMHHSKIRDESHSKLFGEVGDVMSNMKTVLSFKKESEEMDRLSIIQKDYTHHSNQMLKCSMVGKFIIFPLTLSYVGVLILSTRLFKKTDHFISLIVMAFIILASMDKLTDAVEAHILRLGSLDNAINALTDSIDIKDADTSKTPIHILHKDAIQFINVSFAYPGDGNKNIFQYLNINFEMSKVNVLMGEIGRGKSTIFELLAGFQKPTGGTILWPDVKTHTLSTLSVADIRKRVFQMPQTPRLFNRSIYENIVYGLPEDKKPNKEEVRRFMIEDLALGDFVEALGNNGMDSSVGVHGTSLSGGQRQIVWFVKLFLLNPDIILLDEPSASLDDATKKWVFSLFERLVQEKKTIIIITHDPFLLKFADIIIKLE